MTEHCDPWHAMREVIGVHRDEVEHRQMESILRWWKPHARQALAALQEDPSCALQGVG